MSNLPKKKPAIADPHIGEELQKRAIKLEYYGFGESLDQELDLYKSFSRDQDQYLREQISIEDKCIDEQLVRGSHDGTINDSGQYWLNRFGKAMWCSQVLQLTTLFEGFLKRVVSEIAYLNNCSDQERRADVGKLKKVHNATILAYKEYIINGSSGIISIPHEEWEPISALVWARNVIVHDSGVFYYEVVDATSYPNPESRQSAKARLERATENLKRNLRVSGFSLDPSISPVVEGREYELCFTDLYLFNMEKAIRPVATRISDGVRTMVEREKKQCAAAISQIMNALPSTIEAIK